MCFVSNVVETEIDRTWKWSWEPQLSVHFILDCEFIGILWLMWVNNPFLSNCKRLVCCIGGSTREVVRIGHSAERSRFQSTKRQGDRSSKWLRIAIDDCRSEGPVSNWPEAMYASRTSCDVFSIQTVVYLLCSKVIKQLDRSLELSIRVNDLS